MLRFDLLGVPFFFFWPLELLREQRCHGPERRQELLSLSAQHWCCFRRIHGEADVQFGGPQGTAESEPELRSVVHAFQPMEGLPKVAS